MKLYSMLIFNYYLINNTYNLIDLTVYKKILINYLHGVIINEEICLLEDTNVDTYKDLIELEKYLT